MSSAVKYSVRGARSEVVADVVPEGRTSCFLGGWLLGGVFIVDLGNDGFEGFSGAFVVRSRPCFVLDASRFVEPFTVCVRR